MKDINEMAEVEIKIELSPSIYKKISQIIISKGFTFVGIDDQTDYYLEFEKVEKGYNFKRLRVIPGQLAVITEKTWKIIENEKFRVENEYKISDEEKVQLINSDVKFIAKKCRINYIGQYAGCEMHICEDTLFLKKSTRHLLECEIITSLENAMKAKDIVLQWFKDVLEIDDVLIAPSILEMIMADAE